MVIYFIRLNYQVLFSEFLAMLGCERGKRNYLLHVIIQVERFDDKFERRGRHGLDMCRRWKGDILDKGC